MGTERDVFARAFLKAMRNRMYGIMMNTVL